MAERVEVSGPPHLLGMLKSANPGVSGMYLFDICRPTWADSEGASVAWSRDTGQTLLVAWMGAEKPPADRPVILQPIGEYYVAGLTRKAAVAPTVPTDGPIGCSWFPLWHGTNIWCILTYKNNTGVNKTTNIVLQWVTGYGWTVAGLRLADYPVLNGYHTFDLVCNNTTGVEEFTHSASNVDASGNSTTGAGILYNEMKVLEYNPNVNPRRFNYEIDISKGINKSGAAWPIPNPDVRIRLQSPYIG